MSIKPCDPDVFDNGQSVCLVVIPKETAEEICRSLSAATGCKIDWHYFGGRVHIKALAAPVVERQPVAWIKPDVATTLRKDECCYAFGEQNPKGSLIPLYAAPTAWKLPEPHGKQSNLKNTQYAMGWNACLDSIKELNK